MWHKYFDFSGYILDDRLNLKGNIENITKKTLISANLGNISIENFPGEKNMKTSYFSSFDDICTLGIFFGFALEKMNLQSR